MSPKSHPSGLADLHLSAKTWGGCPGRRLNPMAVKTPFLKGYLLNCAFWRSRPSRVVLWNEGLERSAGYQIAVSVIDC